MSHLNARVRLIRDIPLLKLKRGDVGVVRSIWLTPEYRYEVEFRRPGQIVCAMLDPAQVELVEGDCMNSEGREARHAPVAVRFWGGNKKANRDEH